MKPSAPDSKVLKSLLDKICVEFGFCLSADKTEELLKNPPLESTLLTQAILEAEGIGDDCDLGLRRELKQLISETL